MLGTSGTPEWSLSSGCPQQQVRSACLNGHELTTVELTRVLQTSTLSMHWSMASVASSTLHLCLLLDCCTTERNKEPILAALKQHLPNEGLVLEIASGTGQHAAHFAAAVPTWQWQPTDVTDEGFDSIRAYTVQLPNVLPPLVLDASAPAQQWPSLKCAAVYVANVTHISPWCVRGLVFGLLLG